MERLPNEWAALLREELTQPYYLRLEQLLEEEYKTEIIYPEQRDLFQAFRLTSYTDTKVVILGQDPYHGADQAHGLSFSVKPGVKLPPSLRNIYKELSMDLGFPISASGSLKLWAEQGVLLLNTVLTVRKNSPNSHKGIGWGTFTDYVISLLDRRDTPLVFILWGNHAQQKLPLINRQQHCVITSAHPSPFAANKGFFGSRPFSKTNQFLEEIGSSPIDWKLP